MDVLYPLRVLHGKMHHAFLPYKGFVKSCFSKKRLANENFPIDFVVTWVDDRDPIWRAERTKYDTNSANNDGKGDERFRDWDLFRYWFRAVETYAPWVNKVYLVTCGQIPDFLDINNPKLCMVDHRDIIPEKYLPVFNSNSIEMCLWNIPGLSEHFIYFNDDVFLNRAAKPKDFFTNGLPNYCAIAKPRCNHIEASYYHNILIRLEAVINSHFYLSKCIEKSPEKWFSWKYGKDAKYNKRTYEDGFLTSMEYSHVASPYRKSTFATLSETIPEFFDETCSHRFRSLFDISHQIAMLWEICNGTFEPVSKTHYGKLHSLRMEFIDDVCADLEKSEKLMLCINDNEYVSHEDYLQMKEIIRTSFEKKFPQKSCFEK